MAGQYIIGLYDELEIEVIKDIARRVAKAERFTETAEIQAKALRAQGYSPARIEREVLKELNANSAYWAHVAQNTKEYKQAVKQIIADTVADAAINGDYLTAAAGEMAWNDDLQVWQDHGVDLKKDNTLRQIQKAYANQTAGALRNITRTTAMQVGGVPILQAYHHELDLAIIKTASGAFSFQQAMEDCCRRLGQGGVQVIYPSGKKYSMEAAARMTMKTGLSQLAGKITEENMEKTSTALVYVSAHAGARPEHAEWQGKVYTFKGKPSKKYPDFYEATGYGTVTGLKGVNCSHEFYPHWEGDPIPEFKEPEPVNIDGKDYTFYEATQKQREMERSVRNMKREAAAAEAAGNQKKADELRDKVKQTRQEYNDFSRQAGLRPKTERMKIYDEVNPAKTGGLGNIAPVSRAKNAIKTATAPKVNQYKGHPNDSLAKNLTVGEYEAVKSRVSKCKNKDLYKLWDQYEDKITVQSTNHNGTAKHVEGVGIYMDINKVKKGNSFKAPYNTLFHESAHNLDREVGVLKGFGGSASVRYQNGLFTKTIKDEVKGLVDQKAQEIKQTLVGHESDYAYLEKHGVIDKYDLFRYTKGFNTGPVKYSRDLAFRALRDEVVKLSQMKMGDLSDILQGATKSKIRCGIGHEKKYYEGAAGDQRLAKEAFAEITAAEMTQPESLETIKKYLPKTYDVYCEIVKSMIQ